MILINEGVRELNEKKLKEEVNFLYFILEVF